MKRSVAALLVLLGGASYGLLGTFVNFGYGEGYTVGEMTGSQMFFGALFLWVVALFNRRTWKKMRIKTVLLLVSAGSLNGLTGCCTIVRCKPFRRPSPLYCCSSLRGSACCTLGCSTD